jgi:hypothetical protein
MKYKNKILNKNRLLVILIINSCIAKEKIFFPSKFYYIEDKNKNQNIKNKRIIDILNAHNLYYSLYYKSLNEKDIMEIINYINKYYPYHLIHKKALILAIYRLSLLNSYENIDKLQNLLYDYYPYDTDIYFGSLFLLYEKVSHLNNNIQNNINIILDIQNSIHYVYWSGEKKFTKKINYIIHYFLCEYYLVHSIEAFNANKYINSIVYLKKILIRSNTHPRCALEALLLMIEIFCILDSQLLVEKYMGILKKICVLNKENPSVKEYYLRGIYICNSYGFKK